MRTPPGEPAPADRPAPAGQAALPGTDEPTSPLQRWWWAPAWALAAIDLCLLRLTPLACAGFSIVYPALWIAHRSLRTAIGANLVFGAGVTVCLSPVVGVWQALLIAVLSTAGSLSIGFWIIWMDSMRQRTKQALADKEEALAAAQRALEELAQAQEALVTAERQAAASAERQRWAHEVHDTLAQSFISLITLSQVAASACGEEAEHAHERMIAISREGLGEARALIAGHRPTALRAGLRQALAHLCQAQADHGGPRPDLELALAGELPAQVEAVVLRVVQEALTNVRRHARATQVRVEVVSEGAELVVRVQDDGAGLQGAPEGTGLTGMRQRLEALGGSLTVDPARAEAPKGMTGTLLEARIPV